MTDWQKSISHSDSPAMKRAERLIFLVGIAGVIAGTIGIRTAQDISWIKFFDNLHWTFSTASAAILVWIGWRNSKGTEHSPMLFWSAIGLTGYALGQVAWDIQTALSYEKFPTPSDLFYLWIGPGLCLGMFRYIRGLIRREDRIPVLLDINALFIASLTLVLDLYLPKRGDISFLHLAVLVAYPLTLIMAFCIGLVMIPALKLKNTPNLWLFLMSVGVTAWSWMRWNLMALDGKTIDGELLNISFSVAVLFMGRSLARWRPETSSNASWIEACESILRMLPLFSVIIASIAVIVTFFRPDLPALVSKSTIAGSLTVIVLAIVRQMMLLREIESGQKALGESEKRYRLIVSTANEGILVLGPDAETVFANARMADMLQLCADEIIGRPLADFVFRDEMEDHIIRMKRRREGLSEIYERRLLRRDGETVWTQVSATPLFDEEQRFIGSFGMFADITGLKMKENALRQSEEALRLREKMLNESQRVGQVGGWDWNQERDSFWWSDEYCHIHGFDTDMPPQNYEAHLKSYTPESAAQLDAAVKHSMETGEPYELDLELAKPTRATRWIVARCEVKRDENGRICGLRGTVQNITERKLMEMALRSALSYNRILIETSLDPLVTIGPDGKITDVNAATEAATGFGRDDLIGNVFSAYVTDPSAAEAGYQRVYAEGAVRNYPLEIRHRDGRIMPVLYNAAVYRDEGGRVIGVFAAARDISERKKAEDEIRRLNAVLEQRVSERTSALEHKGEELRESQIALMNIVEDLNEKTAELEGANEKLKELDRLKSMFIASMSHELRTPLNSIIGFSSILINEWAGPLTGEQKENLSTILRAGKHLLSLINDVIDVSKIEAGKLDSFDEEFDLFELMSEAVQSLSQEASTKCLKVEVRAVHKLMNCDRRRLLQCMLNLVSNAVKFTETGSVTVSSASREGGMVEISVSDTGIGICEDDQSRLFTPFMRLETNMKSVVPGTGLGLYLTRKLVKDVLKGDILLSSAAGKGSTFTLLIPVNAAGRA